MPQESQHVFASGVGSPYLATTYQHGASPASADEHATVLLATLEPLDTVERYFAAGAPSTPIGSPTSAAET